MTQPEVNAGSSIEEGRADAVRRRILVRGAVQGVGFRPFVYREATAHGLAGWVGNSPEGVTIEVEGGSDGIAGLVEAIRRSPPGPARVAGVTMQAIAPCGEGGFSIRNSRADGAREAQILADLATCDACLAEMRDPADRRYRYPFVNCTQCGPRYSIVEDIPYDRARTSMRRFALCAACQAEYDDPTNRRFHAEPNACPVCGPRLALWDRSGTVLGGGDAALRAAAAALRQGRIVAVKGIGGFHLLVDAGDEAAVLRLRQRKRREAKPFAVMFPSLAAVRECCRLAAVAEAVLCGPARPIVLLPWRGGDVAPSVAPGNARLGALLPYAPLHHLLMAELGFPVVATSGNLSDEPIVIDEAEALRRLAGIADLLLVHDRPIVRPLDDSVAQIVCGEPQLLRRARGFAPEPVAAGDAVAGLLAFGGHLKATVALGHRGGVVLSQHLGDLDTVTGRAAHAAARADIVRLHDATPGRAVRDLHPDYASSRAAELSGLPVVAVQHHLAHVAACLAEHGLEPPALGVAWDGTGYGTDGTVWGGEFLLLRRGAWRRLGRLRPFRLPGGEAAAREPRRAALGLLYAAFGDQAFAMSELPPVASFRPAELAVLRTALAHGVNAPLASSMGRLFDAVAALCGLRQRNRFEGEAAMALEQAAGNAGAERAYAFPLTETDGGEPEWELDWRPALRAMLADLAAGADAGGVSARFHAGLAAAIAAAAARIGEPRVVLTGGCFQNARLTEAAVAALRNAGFQPLWHRTIPPNDGGIALGQVAWSSWLERGRAGPCA
jgi:hydrogenase maturation protein HypF